MSENAASMAARMTASAWMEDRFPSTIASFSFWNRPHIPPNVVSIIVSVILSKS